MSNQSPREFARRTAARIRTNRPVRAWATCLGAALRRPLTVGQFFRRARDRVDVFRYVLQQTLEGVGDTRCGAALSSRQAPSSEERMFLVRTRTRPTGPRAASCRGRSEPIATRLRAVDLRDRE